ncbi:hypothetical protein [Solidesulfovibrio sp.]|uniref:hypothetical protein n=1 Tax=Solidesulfovibrio sp. TaxID=2910990 RepID=UPI0026313650|nr:hypothetical protein [Solidesulfovibrio sp.]
MKIKRFALAVAFLSIAVLSRPVSSGATGLFNQYAGFGDSTLDSGYFRYNTTGSATQDAESPPPWRPEPAVRSSGQA